MAKMDKGKNPKKKSKLVLNIIGWIILLIIFVFSCLNLFVESYEPTIFGYRIFNVVTDSMDGTISQGTMIFDESVKNIEDIKEGDIITYKARAGGQDIAVTHRVIRIETKDGETYLKTKGDNAPQEDAYFVTFDDLLGKFTGFQIPLIGYIFAFLGSTEGIVTLATIIFILVLSSSIIAALKLSERHESTFFRAIAKSFSTLNANGSAMAITNDSLSETMYIMSLIADGNHKDSKVNKVRDKIVEQYVEGEDLAKIEYEAALKGKNITLDGEELSSKDISAIAEFREENNVGIKSIPSKVMRVFGKDKKLSEKESIYLKTHREKQEKTRQEANEKQNNILSDYSKLYEIKKHIFEKQSAIDEYENSINWINLGIAKASTPKELDNLKAKLVSISEKSLEHVATLADIKFEYSSLEDNINKRISELDVYIKNNNALEIKQDMSNQRKEKVAYLTKDYDKYTKHYLHGVITKQLLEDVDKQKEKLEKLEAEREQNDINEQTLSIEKLRNQAVACNSVKEFSIVLQKVLDSENLQNSKYENVAEKFSQLKSFCEQKFEQLKIDDSNSATQNSADKEILEREVEQLLERYNLVSLEMNKLRKQAYEKQSLNAKAKNKINMLNIELSSVSESARLEELSIEINTINSSIAKYDDEITFVDTKISEFKNTTDSIKKQVENILGQHNYVELSISAKYEFEIIDKDVQADFDRFALQYKEEQARIEALQQADSLRKSMQMQAEKTQQEAKEIAEQAKISAMKEVENMRMLMMEQTEKLQKTAEEKEQEAKLQAQKQLDDIRKQMQKTAAEASKQATEKVALTKTQILRNILRDIKQCMSDSNLTILINDIRNFKSDLKPEYNTSEIQRILQECEMAVSLKRAEFRQQQDKKLKMSKVIERLNSKIIECRQAIPSISSIEQAKMLSDSLTNFEDSIDAEYKTEKVIFAISKCRDSILHAGQIAELKNRKKTKKVIHKTISVKKKPSAKKAKAASSVKKKRKIS